MNEEILNTIQTLLDLTIIKFQNSQSAKSYFFDWQKSNQSNPNFSCILNTSINSTNPEEIQFCLESILSLSIKISLLREQYIKTNSLDLQKLQKIGIEKVSKMLFEKDFYSWMIEENDDTIKKEILCLSNKLESYSYFNDIYECLFEGTGRKSKGQFFTEKDLADFIIRTAHFKPKDNQTNYLLDPASGAGAFIVALFDTFKNEKNVSIFGVDKSYFACVLSRIVYLKKYFQLYNKYPDFIPIFWMDFLVDFNIRQFIESSQPKKIIGPYSSLENKGINYLLYCQLAFKLVSFMVPL